MIHVHAHSRLHFGLLNPFKELRADGALPKRRFGGVGMMIAEPALKLTAYPADSWSADGPQASRALAFAHQFAAAAPAELVRPQQIVIESMPPEHAGLGSGTQLALAVGSALAEAWAWKGIDVCGVAETLGRGQRSAIGIHGFARGGFLVEGGKSKGQAISPLVARADFPDDWRVVLAIPQERSGLHGQAEIQAFERLGRSDSDAALVDRLCRLALLGLLPAVQERDIRAFGEALFEFNRLAGEAFSAVQGGTYATPAVETLIRFFRSRGAVAVAQSSWGPAIAVIADGEEHARSLVERTKKQPELPGVELIATRGCNCGASVTQDTPSPHGEGGG